MSAELSDVMLTLLQTIHDDVQKVKRTLEDHINTEPEEWAAVLDDLSKKAFPAGDPEGHRKYHEDEMKFMEARADFWKKMLFEVTKYGIFGVLGWLAYITWTAFLQGPQK
jgi:hypothetical protein